MTAEGRADRDGARAASGLGSRRSSTETTSTRVSLSASSGGRREPPSSSGNGPPGDVAVEEIRRDRGGDPSPRPAAPRAWRTVVKTEQLAEHDRGAQPASAGQPGKVRPHRMPISDDKSTCPRCSCSQGATGGLVGQTQGLLRASDRAKIAYQVCSRRMTCRSCARSLSAGSFTAHHARAQLRTVGESPGAPRPSKSKNRLDGRSFRRGPGRLAHRRRGMCSAPRHRGARRWDAAVQELKGENGPRSQPAGWGGSASAAAGLEVNQRCAPSLTHGPTCGSPCVRAPPA